MRAAKESTSAQTRLEVLVGIDFEDRGVGAHTLGHRLQQAEEVVAHHEQRLAASGVHARHVAA